MRSRPRSSRGGDPGLQDALRRGGFSTVTVRNDASSQKYLAPAPPLISGALLASGLHKIASFGAPLSFTSEQNPSNLEINQIDVYGVAGGGDVAAYDVADAAVVSGGPESPMALAAAGDGDRAYILANDLSGLDVVPPNWIVTDGNRRRFNYFGLNRNNISYVLSATDGSPNEQTLDSGLLPTDVVENQTVAVLHGARSITASSSGSWLLGIPEAAPYRAFDGDPATAWTSGPTTSSVGEWLQIDLDAPTTASSISVKLLEDGPWRPKITSLKVTTAAGEIIDEVQPDESRQTIALPPGETDWIRLTFNEASSDTTQTAGAGIREVEIPGVSVVRRLVPPSELNDLYRDPSRPLPAYFFQRARTNPHSLLRSDEETGIAREFVVPRAGSATVAAQVSARPGPWLLNLVNNGAVDDRLDGLTISASSTLRDLPEYAARNLLDDDPATVWVSARASAVGDSTNPIAAQADDPDPHITIAWLGPRSIDSLKIDTAPNYSAPTQVRVTNGSETRDGAVGADGTVHLNAPIVAEHLDISFPELNRVAVLTGDPTRDRNPLARPLGLAGLEIPALDGLHPGPLDRATEVHISCEDGPVVRVNDTDVHLSVDATGADIMLLNTVPAHVCDGQDVALEEGTNTLDSSMGVGAFNVNSVNLQDSASPLPTVGTAREVTKQKWTRSDRTIEIGPGAATYLVVNENVNKGWVATLDGQQLEPTVVDGWRQAYVVPEGAGGTVHLRYKPDATYHIVLIVGLLCALVPFAMLLLPARRKDDAPVLEGQWSTPLLWLTAITGALLIGGLGAVLLVPFWFLGRRRPGSLGLIAAGSYTVAAIWVALTVQPFKGTWRGAFGWPATVLSIVAVMGVAVGLLLDPGRPKARRRRSRRDSRQPTRSDHVIGPLPWLAEPDPPAPTDT